MSKASRGGLTLKTGKIGRVNCLRQQLMMPGERMNISLNGTCRLESLRERDAMRINAHLAVFMTPLRWLWPEFPDYLKEGPTTIKTVPAKVDLDWAKYGIGSKQTVGYNFPAFFDTSLQRIHNEWYKWPEDADITAIPDDGPIAVPLSKSWTRARYDANPNQGETVATPGDVLDVRNLAAAQATFRSAMKRDVLSYNRWMELIEQAYKGDGSREVDQVPIMIDQTEVGVNPREIPATDGASLGQWQSLYDFQIDHQIRGVTAPEHCVLSYMLTVRFPAITESLNPLAGYLDLGWYDYTADPEYLSAAQPQEVYASELFPNGQQNEFMGYLPAGWQWRSDSDVIGGRIDARNSFPYMNQPTTKEEAKDATRIKDAFRSQSLGDYLCDIYIKEDSTQPIGTSMDSYMSGMVDHQAPSDRNRNDEFPHGGKML